MMWLWQSSMMHIDEVYLSEAWKSPQEKNDPRIDRAFAHIKGDGTYLKVGSKTKRIDPGTLINDKFANITGHSASSSQSRGSLAPVVSI